MPAIGVRPWTPDKIPTVAWLDASALSTITEGTPPDVSDWADRSPNGNDFTQATPEQRPHTGVRTLGQYNILDFTTSQNLRRAVSLGHANSFSIFMVGDYDSGTALYSETGSGSQAVNITSSSLSFQTDGSLNYLAPLSGPYIVSAHIDHLVQAEAFVDGVSQGTRPLTVAVGNGTTNRLNQNFVGGSNADGGIAEFIIVDDITSETRQQIEGYLAHKWGLTANLPEDHPFKYRPPADSSLALEPEDWDPTSITTAAWYDAADPATIIDTTTPGEVEQWSDKSGNGNHVTEATNKPNTGTRTLNGLNVLDFALGDRLRKLTPTGLPTAGLDVYVVGVDDGSATSYTLKGTTAQFRFNLAAFSGYYIRNDAGAINSTTGSLADTNPHLASINYDGDFASTYYDGTIDEGPNNVADLPLTLDDLIGIGVSAFSVGVYDGAFAEFIITPHLSDTDRQKMEGYLAHKWGLTANLPADHPYKTKKPQRFKTKLWTPNDIATNAWYDAADASTITDAGGGAVSQWDDKSGNARHGTQAVGTSRPAYEAAGFNGRPTINFGISDNLAITMPAGTLKAFVVTKPTPNSNLTVIQNIGSNTFIPFAVDGAGSSNVFRVDSSNDPVGLEMYVNGNTTPVNRTQNDMYDALITNNPGGVLVNFSDIPVGTGTTLNKIGDDTSGWNAVGRVCELVYVDAAIAVADVQKIEGYLAWKWGFPHQLPDTHPYKRRPPMV